MTTKLPGVPDTHIEDIIPPGAFSAVGIATAIPVVAVRWMDERIGCRLAHLYQAGEIQGTPDQYGGCFFYQAGGGCTMNSRRAADACLFHLSESTPEWNRLREWAMLIEPDGNTAICQRQHAHQIAADLGAQIVGAVKIAEPRR